MKKIAIIMVLLSLLFFASSCSKDYQLGAITNFSVKDTLSEGNNEKIRVIILYGQSNATGCTNNIYLQEKAPDVYEKASNGIDGIYINHFCENGGNFSNNEFVICSLGEGATKNHFGPEIGIALSYQEAGLNCFIIKYSWGGSILDNQWMNGKYGRGEMYEAAINFTKASLNYLISKGYDYEIDGICWMQGESDANPTLSKRYYTNTKNFVKFLRRDLSYYQKTIDFIDAGISDSPYWTQHERVNNAKLKFSNEDEHNYYFDTIDAGLHYNQEPVEGPDMAHYDSESEILLGKLFASVAIYQDLNHFKDGFSN